MARWADVAEAEPEFAAEVAAALDAYMHKTLATLRADGSPRISGQEARFVEGDLYFGSMPGALKARDLRRDPRFALHGGTGDVSGETWERDVKVAGRAVEITDADERKRIFEAWGSEVPEGPSHLFRADLTEVIAIGLNEAKSALVIRTWTADGRGLRTIERA
ncbi:pyridoxamine 5'-phosphate oxidase family protein [Yinghuangia seranimata]|uniref:pyridoxamine 5'-phosphate oxidase family protein n=1 Tax=Yinghuangia seranimata TaxID=408067 RepID=UPI00248D0483|nr:pyridoxamine 5'-phosphate oxidase family protein [Yinghuangia seranimata]MDI2131095.1 pyridoxamine 5'-phosphate oxidase family protein [Yinghuangia seranimata]